MGNFQEKKAAGPSAIKHHAVSYERELFGLNVEYLSQQARNRFAESGRPPSFHQFVKCPLSGLRAHTVSP